VRAQGRRRDRLLVRASGGRARGGGRLKRALLLAAAGALLSACAHQRLAPGPYKDGYAVEVSAPTVEEARRAAVGVFFDLYLSSPSASGPLLEDKILKRARSFIAREKAKPENGRVTLRALVDYQRLGHALDAAGLVRPEGVKGKPKVLVSLREDSKGVGRASDTLRRRLLQRGYAALDDSDSLNGGLQKTGAREEALAHGARLGAEVVVTGTAAGKAAPDPRLAGYGSCRAVVDAQAVKLPGEGLAAKVAQEAAAVDMSEAAACAKALESAGEIAADKIAAALASVYQERVEFTVTVMNLGNLDRTRQFLQAARALPRVAAAAFDDAGGADVRVKVWADKMGADDMTAELLKLKDFKLEVRDVDPAINYIEFGTGDVY
jgi:hypothetical protein